MRPGAVPVRIIAIQALIGVFGGLIWLLDSPAAALAALAGGLGSALLSLQVAARVYAQKDTAPPQAIVAAFYRAEVFKLFGAALMFGIMAKYFAAQFVPFVVTFVVTLFVFAAALRWRIDTGPAGDETAN